MSEHVCGRMVELDIRIKHMGTALLVRVHAAGKSYCILDSKTIGTDKRS